jgi:hypothetical protein
MAQGPKSEMNPGGYLYPGDIGHQRTADIPDTP